MVSMRLKTASVAIRACPGLERYVTPNELDSTLPDVEVYFLVTLNVTDRPTIGKLGGVLDSFQHYICDKPYDKRGNDGSLGVHCP